VSVELSEAPAPLAAIARPEWLHLARRARLLSWASLAYMAVEGGVAVVAGVIAASPALIGFGIDSAIEGFASLIIVWRFTGARLLSAAAERRAQRLVAVQFFLLAPYVGYESLDALLGGERPDASWVGIALSMTSLALMPYLGRAKRRIGERMGSVALRGEGQQNLLCSYLSAALLVGLGGNALLGWWWLDPVAGLVIAAVALKEGVEAWRGEGCCAPPVELDEPLDGCADACCSRSGSHEHGRRQRRGQQTEEQGVHRS
jgi:divalent metal cation (Fe/Co/Zn/Cd) transporter